jgi:hypothetical protein
VRGMCEVRYKVRYKKRKEDLNRTNTLVGQRPRADSSEVGGVKAPAAPTGKSFRFVRACVRACVRSKGRSIFANWSDAGPRVLLSAFLGAPGPGPGPVLPFAFLPFCLLPLFA